MLRGFLTMWKNVSVRAAVAALLSSVSLAAPAFAETPRKVDVPAGDLSGEVSADSGAAPASETPVVLEQIVVTAQKKSENIQDVPVAVTAISAESLSDQNVNTLRDMFSQIPGLSYQGASGQNTIILRGIATSTSGNPTVAVTVDDVPFGSNQRGGGGANLYPDLDPSTLSGVEVLKGPQGTLYGASSLGGLLKYVTLTPSTDTLSGKVEVGNQFLSGDGGGEYGRGSVSIPLVQNAVGLEVSAFYREDPGFIYDTLTHQDHVNYDHADGEYGALLIKPVDNLSVKFSVLDQRLFGNDGPDVQLNQNQQPVYGDLQENVLNSPYSSSNRLYAIHIDAGLGFANLTSVTGYGQTGWQNLTDYTAMFATIGALFGYPNDRELVPQIYHTNKLTQELRLSSIEGGKLDWLAGVFYQHELSSNGSQLNAIDETTGNQDAQLINQTKSTSYRETAFFGNATFHFTNAFDVAVGARVSHVVQTWIQDASGLIPVAEDGAHETISGATANPYTWQFSPRYKFADNLMTYLRIATGYQPAGPNTLSVGVPTTYGSDNTIDYELGVKGMFLDNRLSFDASLFWIVWNNPQVAETSPTTQLTFLANAGKARSRGLELQTSYTPWAGMTLSGNAAYTDAMLTQSLPADSDVVALAGNRLPYSARFTGYVSAEQRFDLHSDWTPYAAASVTYVGQRYSDFGALVAAPPDPERLSLPSYTTLDLRAGTYYGSWAFDFIVRNVTDDRGWVGGELNVSTTTASGYTVNVIQPRTYGVSASYKF
jgi:iron complex outermembrane recepter protein